MNSRLFTSISLSLLPASLYMLSNSQTYSWGSGTFGQLGLGDESSRPLPQLVQNVSFEKIQARGQLSAGVDKEGKVFGWGRAKNGVFGLANQDFGNLQTPTLLDFMQGKIVRSLGEICFEGILRKFGFFYKKSNKFICERRYINILIGLGVSHMAVVDETGSLFIWGSNEHGKLGHSNVEDRSSKFYSP